MAMKASKLPKFDTAEFLDSAEAIAAYLEEVFQDEDPSEIAKALGNVARAKGMTDIARKTGLSRESLYKALSGDGNPEFATVLKVMKALETQLSVAIAART